MRYSIHLMLALLSIVRLNIGNVTLSIFRWEL